MVILYVKVYLYTGKTRICIFFSAVEGNGHVVCNVAIFGSLCVRK